MELIPAFIGVGLLTFFIGILCGCCSASHTSDISPLSTEYYDEKRNHEVTKWKLDRAVRDLQNHRLYCGSDHRFYSYSPGSMIRPYPSVSEAIDAYHLGYKEGHRAGILSIKIHPGFDAARKEVGEKLSTAMKPLKDLEAQLK